MNYKDKESFEKWFKDFYEVDFDAGNARFMGQLISWQAACEYKDMQLINGSKMKQMNDRIENLKEENKKVTEYKELTRLQADTITRLERENKKLRDALESISKDYDRPSDMMKKAREALKETNDK